MSLCTRTCVLSTVLWIIWLVGTCLCLSSGTSIPIKMLALRYLSRLLYRLDGWYLVWELPIEGDATKTPTGTALGKRGTESLGVQASTLSVTGIGVTTPPESVPLSSTRTLV